MGSAEAKLGTPHHWVEKICHIGLLFGDLVLAWQRTG
jgi:hypothetical protein